MWIPGEIEIVIDRISVCLITNNFLAILGEYGALQIPVAEGQVFTGAGGWRLDGGQQAYAVSRRGRVDLGEVTQCWEEVEMIAKLVALSILRYARAAHDERDLCAVLVKVLLAHESMAPEGQPVVCGVDNDGVVAKAQAVQLCEQPSDMIVSVGHHCIIICYMFADALWSSWEGGEQFIAHT